MCQTHMHLNSKRSRRCAVSQQTACHVRVKCAHHSMVRHAADAMTLAPAAMHCTYSRGALSRARRSRVRARAGPSTDNLVSTFVKRAQELASRLETVVNQVGRPATSREAADSDDDQETDTKAVASSAEEASALKKSDSAETADTGDGSDSNEVSEEESDSMEEAEFDDESGLLESSEEDNFEADLSANEFELKFTAEEWDACVRGCARDPGNPFLSHAFLSALEHSGSAVPRTGWLAQHLALRDKDGKLHAAVPLYAKSHSMGEYVFDHRWAMLHDHLGASYYPKLQCCVPFTPVTGVRVLVAPHTETTAVRAAALRALMQLPAALDVRSLRYMHADCLQAARCCCVPLVFLAATGFPAFDNVSLIHELSNTEFWAQWLATKLQMSSVHITFSTEADWKAAASVGWMSQMDLQYHWENDGYKTFDDFLAALKSSKRRSIRQERKSMAKQNLRIKRLRGAEITSEVWDKFFEFYMDTTDRKWGQAYLTYDFFQRVGRELGDRVLLVVAYDDNLGSELVAGALNFIGDTALYGRNWGCRPYSDYKFLHFELCYYQAIDAAIEMGLERVEAGAQGQHKISRGYLPKATYSSHFVVNTMAAGQIRRFLQRSALQTEANIEALTQQASPFKVNDADLEGLLRRLMAQAAEQAL